MLSATASVSPAQLTSLQNFKHRTWGGLLWVFHQRRRVKESTRDGEASQNSQDEITWRNKQTLTRSKAKKEGLTGVFQKRRPTELWPWWSGHRNAQSPLLLPSSLLQGLLIGWAQLDLESKSVESVFFWGQISGIQKRNLGEYKGQAENNQNMYEIFLKLKYIVWKNCMDSKVLCTRNSYLLIPFPHRLLGAPVCVLFLSSRL